MIVFSFYLSEPIHPNIALNVYFCQNATLSTKNKKKLMGKYFLMAIMRFEEL